MTRCADNKSVSPDLCEEHSEPYENLFEILPHGRRGQTRARTVLTAEEVEALSRKPTKRTAKRVATKKTARKRS